MNNIIMNIYTSNVRIMYAMQYGNIGNDNNCR